MAFWYKSAKKIGVFVERELVAHQKVFVSFAERLAAKGDYLLIPFIGLRARRLLETYADDLVALTGDLTQFRSLNGHNPNKGPEVSWFETATSDYSIGIDGYELGRRGAESLIELGLRDIALLKIDAVPYGKSLRDGFMDAAAEAGVRGVIWNYRRESDVPAWIMNCPKPIGVLGADDWAASKALRYGMDLGVDTPGQMAVMGISDNPLACSISGPGTLSSISLPWEAVGIAAADLMLELLEGEPTEKRVHTIAPSSVVHRLSTDRFYFEDEHLRAALEFINRRYAEGRCLDLLYASVSVSRRSLERRFRDAVGMSPRRRLEHVRLKHAQELLKSTNHKVDYIASLSGFPSGWEMNRVFKRILGLSPSSYRERFR